MLKSKRSVPDTSSFALLPSRSASKIPFPLEKRMCFPSGIHSASHQSPYGVRLVPSALTRMTVPGAMNPSSWQPSGDHLGDENPLFTCLTFVPSTFIIIKQPGAPQLPSNATCCPLGDQDTVPPC